MVVVMMFCISDSLLHLQKVIITVTTMIDLSRMRLSPFRPGTVDAGGYNELWLAG